MKNSGILLKLKESKTLNSLISDAGNSKKPAFVIDPNAKLLFYNKAWLRYRGTESEISTDLADFVHPGDLGEVRGISGKIGVSEEPVIIEFRLKDVSGGYNWFRAIIDPRFVGEGKLLACIGYCSEYPEKTQYEINAQSLEAILRANAVGIVVKDKNGENKVWNSGASTILGYTEQEMVGRTSKDYALSEHFDDIDKMQERILSGENITQIEVVRKRKDGTSAYLLGSNIPLADGNNGVAGSIAVFRDITEIKLLEKNHNFLENTLFSLFDNLTNALCLYELVTNGDGLEDLRVVISNKAYAKLFNQTCDMLRGKLFSEISPSGRKHLQSFMPVAKTGVGINFDMYEAHFKQYINIMAYCPMLGQVAIVLTDRTEQVETEEALRARESDLSTLFSSMVAGFCLGAVVRNANGEIEDIVLELVNDAYERLEGFEPGTLRGKGLKEINPEQMNRYLPILTDVAVNGTKASFRKVVASGVTVEVICFSPSEGHFVCIENDVSEQVKAEEELKKAHRDMENLLREIPAPICVINAYNGYILDANAAFIDLCSAPDKKELLGKSISVFFKQPKTDTEAQDLFKILHRGGSFKCKMSSYNKSEIDIEVFSSSFIFNDQSAFAVYCIDLTKRQMRERMLQESVRAAEEASLMKSAFLANISHEIRTPMSGIIGFAELALDDRKVSKRTKDYLMSVKNSADRLLDTIDAVLDITHIETGSLVLENIPFDLHEVLKLCEDIISEKAMAKGIKLYFYTEPYFEYKLLGDCNKLTKALINLLSNAVKFTNKGVVKLMTIAEEIKGGVSVRFEIKDSGIGMTPERLQRVFEPFNQYDFSKKRTAGSTGLGLAVTKGFIEAMGGSLSAESVPGIGSIFSFKIVFGVTDEPSMKRETDFEEKSSKVAQKPLFTGEALVCEDNDINRQIIIEQLSRVGLNVTVAENGQLGVDAVKVRADGGKPFDIILMDIHMPVMDGLEAVKRIREAGCDTPIIAMTANIIAHDRSIYLSHGMSDYIRKPFNSPELWECLLRFLEPVEMTVIVEEASNGLSEMPGSAGVSVINRVLGVERTAGDEKLYKRLLQNFLRDYDSVHTDIIEAVREGDIKKAHRIAHTLKGIASTIGALELADAAGAVEKALYGGKVEYTEEQMKELEYEIGVVIKEISDIAEGGGNSQIRNIMTYNESSGEA